MYCRHCNSKGMLQEKLGGGRDAFLTTGFDNWKKAGESFTQHAKSAVHREAVLKFHSLQQPSIITQLNDQAKLDQAKHRDMLLKQISSLKYLLRHGLAIRGHEELERNLRQLLLLRCEDVPSMKAWIEANKYLSPQILNELIGIMSNQLLKGILHEIKEAVCFALIADEASDVSHKEQLCVNVRWVNDNFVINEAPVELINVPRTDSSTLVTVIKDCLIRLTLPLAQCRGQAYDGASNMAGRIQGVAARVQNDQPSAIYVHCLAHCTNLCLQTVGRQCTPIRDALELVMEVSQLIRFSPKRSTLFESLQTQLSPAAPSLKPLCPTRWTVRNGALKSLLDNYHVLCEALSQINREGRDEYAYNSWRHVEFDGEVWYIFWADAFSLTLCWHGAAFNYITTQGLNCSRGCFSFQARCLVSREAKN